ncbi:MAG: penicillin-binding protein 2 [Gammaproteobacteria bacterium]|nr:penicillin-binding protein 2 [Gammaproteobacteria bacterium]
MATRVRIKDDWQETRIFIGRTLVGGAGIVFLLGILITRLYYLQVHNHQHYATLSDGNRVRIESLDPNRGLIYDANGVLLAENVPNYQLEITPEQVDDIDATVARLGEIIELREADLERFAALRKTQRRFQPIPLRYRMSPEEVARFAINRHEFPGAEIRARLTRRYPHGELIAHALGYLGSINDTELQALDPVQYSGTSQIGKIGIERTYEHLLHGEIGYQQVETNAQGRPLRILDDTQSPTPGMNLFLNLDIKIQQAAFDALGEYKGAVVAMNPNDGAIIAFVSKPSYDPNLFIGGIDSATFSSLQTDKARPLFNRAASGTYPPGSTIKPMLGLAGLYYDLRKAEEIRDCPGAFYLEGNPRPYRDWKREGHGPVDLELAIAESCDIYFYELSLDLGIDRIHSFLGDFQLGKSSGIDLISEADGLLPSREWKRRARGQRWFPGETVITGIGQGYMLATPLQLAQATAVLATRGKFFAPRILGQVSDPVGRASATQAPKPEFILEDIEPEHWDIIHRSMVATVHSWRGTAHSIGVDAPYRIAGKTGTAQVFTLAEDEEYEEEEVAAELRDHGLFIAFAPAENPEIAVAVVVENGGGGGSVAAPVARKILDAYLLDKL